MEKTIMLPSCVHPDGRFRVGIHRPNYRVRNLRARDCHCALGRLPDGRTVDNLANFPGGDIEVCAGHPVYEILNALRFRGCSYIDGGWAAPRALDPATIALKPRAPLSLRQYLGSLAPDGENPDLRACISGLPLPLRYALAATSTDAEELVWLAESCCELIHAADGRPLGLGYEEIQGRIRPRIDDVELFETIANNPHLPHAYKEVMVLRPGVQGPSPISADAHYADGAIFEYLRANSYIPGGHYAANFAHHSPRYRIGELSRTDMRGLRHLYYQRIYTVLAGQLGLPGPEQGCAPTEQELEQMRLAILSALKKKTDCPHPASLWGWNFGYDFSPTGYRLHASHQMIHQQYALVPEWVADARGEPLPAFACGDLVAECLAAYRDVYGSDLFTDYLRCLRENTRTDGGTGTASLVVWEDENVLLFVPKAQVSQWELNIMTVANGPDGPVGNVVEADSAVRASLDQALLTAQRLLERLGARMVTSIEYGKRLGLRNGQRLLYALLPKLPWAMGGFTEAQARFVVGHYPEDFAAACRLHLAEIEP